MVDWEDIETSVKGSATPIYRSVAEALRTRIVSGGIADGEKLPSEEEMSNKLGINHLTLRKSLKILSELKLIEQCQGKGTFVSYRREEHLRIGVVAGNTSQTLGDLYILRMISSLNAALEKHHGELVLIDSKVPNDLMKQINAASCEAVIVLDTRPEVSRYLCRNISGHLPLVFVNGYDFGKTEQYNVCVSMDSAERAARILYDLGHRRIGYVSVGNSYRVKLCDKSFLSACKNLGLSTEYIRNGNGLWYDDSRRLTRELFELAVPPTAIVAPGFLFANGAWQGVMDAGRKIPEDVSFIGFDASLNVNPHMSAMMQNVPKVAEKAMELVFDLRSRGKHLKQHLYEFPAEYADNGSCRELG